MSQRNKIIHFDKCEQNYHKKFLSYDYKLDSSLFIKPDHSLHSQKSSLETLLDFVKKCQMKYITNKSINNTKEILIYLKNHLHSNLNKKNKIYDSLKNKNEMKKTEIQEKMIYGSESTEESVKEIGSIYSEINQLKILNFQIENEIKNTDFLITHKSNKTYNKENNEIICNHNSESIIKNSNIFNNILNYNKNKLVDINKETLETKNEIQSITNQISNLKNKIKELKFKCNIYNTENIVNKSSIIIDDCKSNNSGRIIIDKKWKKKLIEKNIIKEEVFKQQHYRNCKTINKKNINNINNGINYCLNTNNFVKNKTVYNYSAKNFNLNEKLKKMAFEYSLHSFNSSVDSNSLSCRYNNKMIIKNIEFMEKLNKINIPQFILSDDGINTNNSNESSNQTVSRCKSASDSYKKEKLNDEIESYIFSFFSDQDFN